MTLTASKARAMTIPELRRAWDYGRADEQTTARALAELDRRGQICPDGQPYGFGTVLVQHKVGDYTVVESVRDEPVWMKGEHVPPADNESPSFSSYVGERRTGHSWNTMDEALIHCVAFSRMGEADGDGAAMNDAPRMVRFVMRSCGAVAT